MRYFVLMMILCWTSVSVAQELRIGDKAVYEVTVPNTIEEKKQGLMFRKHMPENEGMLFDLRDYPNVAMWMKNTYIPLDMIFIDCDFEVAFIYENAKPFSLEKIISPVPFCYVLEINASETQKRGIAVGDKVLLSS